MVIVNVTKGNRRSNQTYKLIFISLLAIKEVYYTTQGARDSLKSYVGRFDSARTKVDLFGANIMDKDTLFAKLSKSDVKASKDTAYQQFLATCLLVNANAKNKLLWEKRVNDTLLRIDSYPTTIGASTHFLVHWKGVKKASAG